MSAPGQDGAPRRRPGLGVVALVALVVVALAVAGAVGLAGSGREPAATCERTASAPEGGTVRAVAQGAQLVVGDVTLGVGDMVPGGDGCAVRVFGAVETLEVGRLADVGGTPVMLLSVEPRGDGGDEVGGAFEATVWVADE